MSDSSKNICVVVLLLALTMECTAQIVYSLNGTVLRKDERDWVIRSSCGWYGLWQFSRRASEDAPWVRRTEIYFGHRSMAVRLPATAVASMGVAVLASLVFLVLFGVGRIAGRRVSIRAEPIASPNSGPAKQFGHSEVGGGPHR